MATIAKLNFVRIAPQKARLVADQVRGMAVDKAIQLLTFSSKKAAAIINKVLRSAVANAEHNDGADIDELLISKITVDEGPNYKRISARAKGRAARILKRTSHITIEVTERNRK